MECATLAVMIAVAGTVWGGFLFFLFLALRSEKSRGAAGPGTGTPSLKP